MKNPRISVTLSAHDVEVIHLICQKKGISQSALIKKVVEDWLEDYEDMLLARKAEEAEREWISTGRKTVSHEEVCQKFGIE